MHEDRLKLALDFLALHRMAVLATVAADGSPECALVSYAARGGELIFGTDSTTRKYANLKRSPRVAVVVGHEAPRTLQYEGTAEELSGARERELAALLLARHPETAAFVSVPTARTFLVSPRWMRLTDYSTTPPGVLEIRL
jgi:PPOX class probable F420-dependent enzyme